MYIKNKSSKFNYQLKPQFDSNTSSWDKPTSCFLSDTKRGCSSINGIWPGRGSGCHWGLGSRCSSSCRLSALTMSPLTFDPRSIRRPPVLADGAVPRPRPEHYLWRLDLLTFIRSPVKEEDLRTAVQRAHRLWMLVSSLRHLRSWSAFCVASPTDALQLFGPLTPRPCGDPPSVLWDRTPLHTSRVKVWGLRRDF